MAKNSNEESKANARGEGNKIRKVRNRGRDVLWDYYISNKAIGEENKRLLDEEKENSSARGFRFSVREWMMIGIAALAIVGIVIKYLILG